MFTSKSAVSLKISVLGDAQKEYWNTLDRNVSWREANKESKGVKRYQQEWKKLCACVEGN